MTGWVLAIDFGTSNTVAALRHPDGTVHDVLFDGSPTLPSAVYAAPDGTLLTGRDALHSARLAPERFEPNPKLRVDDGTVLLGAEIPVPRLVAAVLDRVAGESRRIAAGAPVRAVLTHPAGWAAQRRGVLTRAAEQAGLTDVTLLPEPVAAARYFQARRERDAAPVVVYDLGAGTLDVAVLRGDEVLACEGLSDAGGLDIDAGLLHRLVAATGTAEEWQAALDPRTSLARRTLRQLQDDVRDAKEMLSRTAQSFIPLPFLDRDAPLNREQVEAVAAPLLDRTVGCVRTALAAAGLRVPPPGPVYLVGGATRMPLVATVLHRELRVAPTVAEHPELVVAHGALLHPGPAGPDAGTATPGRYAEPPRTGSGGDPFRTGSGGEPGRGGDGGEPFRMEPPGTGAGSEPPGTGAGRTEPPGTGSDAEPPRMEPPRGESGGEPGWSGDGGEPYRAEPYRTGTDAAGGRAGRGATGGTSRIGDAAPTEPDATGTRPRVVATKAANAERRTGGGRAGSWVGGRATLTTATIGFHSNLVNRAVGEIVDFEIPLAAVTGVEVRSGLVTRIIEIATADEVARIRCFGADAFAAQIRAQLPARR